MCCKSTFAIGRANKSNEDAAKSILEDIQYYNENDAIHGANHRNNDNVSNIVGKNLKKIMHVIEVLKSIFVVLLKFVLCI